MHLTCELTKHLFGLDCSKNIKIFRVYSKKISSNSSKQALIVIVSDHKEFIQNISDSHQKEIQELENKLSAL